MKNSINDWEDFDEEPQKMLQRSRFIQFAELEKGIYGNDKDLFESIRTSKTFEEISNEYAMSTPQGKNSVFYREMREILTGYIPKL